MIYILYSNLALEFIALAAGTALLAWALRDKKDGSALATFIGTLIIIFTFIAIISTFYSGVMAWRLGYSGMMGVTPEQMQMLQRHQQALGQMEQSLKTQK